MKRYLLCLLFICVCVCMYGCIKYVKFWIDFKFYTKSNGQYIENVYIGSFMIDMISANIITKFFGKYKSADWGHLLDM